ncbi:MAG: aspartate kinase [Planctomycetes bacterium]|nr:aspartate kinase [Planctomycetota bacterium]
MVVMKFGGTSMGNPDAIRRCAELVERDIKQRGKKPVVVVSAYSKITDKLLDAAKRAVKGDIDGPVHEIAKRHHEILKGLDLPKEIGEKNLSELHDLLRGIHMVKEVTPRLYDYVSSFGERLSSKTFAALLRARGHGDSEAINAYDLGFTTDSRFMNARPLPDTYEKIAEAFKPHAHKLVVITGFIGKDKNGDITTIGRSGSDYTAAIFGAALGVDEIQVWKDVPGVMTSDPTVIKDAHPLPKLSFEEASELAYYGAEVLHPATMVPAMKRGIPVRVLHTFDPEAPGTVITPHGETDSKHPVKSIVYKEDQVLINVRSERMLGTEGFMARMFNIFERNHIVIDMISTSEVSVSMTTDVTEGHKLDTLRRDLEEIAKVDIQKDKCIVALVGEGMKHTVGLAARAFKSVAASQVSLQMISQGASEINITFLIDNSQIPTVIKGLHKEFFG